MQHVPRLPILLLISAAAVLAFQAQQTTQESAAAPSQRFAYQVPFIPPISSAPVTATFVIEVARPLPGGGTETWHGMTRVARDSNGRTRHELHELVPSSIGEPPLLYTVISDPLSRVRQTLDPVHRTVFKQQVPISPRSQSVTGIPDGEDLGGRIIDGVAVKGVRRAWAIPSEDSASGGASRVVDETWYSNELQMIVSERRTDSLGQVVTVTISQVDRREPSASLFKAPRGYNEGGLVVARGAGWAVTPPDYALNLRDQGGCCFLPNR